MEGTPQLTPETVLAVEFREKYRGYHQGDVDEFVERVAAGIGDLLARLQQATARAEAAEVRLHETGEGEETLRRTLVLAQRTADLAVQEARQQAAEIVASAEQEAATRLQRADAELVTEVQRLRDVRDRLAAEIDALQRWLTEERAKLRESLAATLQQLDAGEPSLAPAPVIEPVELPSDLAPQPAPPHESHDASASAGDETSLPPATAAPVAGGDEDAFLAELRRAVTDESPLGPRDADPAEADAFAAFVDRGDDDGDDDESGGPLSRLRRRR